MTSRLLSHRPGRALGHLIALIVLALGLIGVEGLALQGARASTLQAAAALTQAAPAKRKKKAKKKQKKAKKKAKQQQQTPAKPAASVGVLPFEGDGGGQAMAGVVLGQIRSYGHADGYQLEIALAPGEERFTPASVRAALQATGTQALVRGMGVREGEQVRLKVFGYAGDGTLRFARSYQTPAGERDALSLGEQIGRDLEQALPGLEQAPEITGAEAAPLQASAPEPATGGSASATSTGGTGATGASTTVDKPAPAGERREPLIAVGLGGDLLYWSYELRSAAMESTVNWHPLEPYFGGALALAVWPMDWLGVDLNLHLGVHSYGGELPIDQDSVDVTALSGELVLRGRYLFGFGVGVGGHLGYRFDGGFVSEQTPTTVAPGFAAHQLSPGLDLYFTALAPLLSARLSADLVPWGLYSEAPDQPGESAGLWGWRVDGALRSIVALGIFVELRAFYQHSYVVYSGAGDRTNFDGNTLSDGQITNGLRGLTLGLGWSY